MLEAPASPPPSIIGSASSQLSIGPSASQLSSPSRFAAPTKEALEALQGAARTKAAQGGADPAKIGDRGSRLGELEQCGSGVWIAAQEGRTWCSAKGPALLNLQKVCVAAVLPKKQRTIEFCSKGRGCNHSLPEGYSVFHSKVPMAPESMLLDNATSSGGRGGKGRGGGGRKGAKGARGGKGKKGKGKRGREKADDDDDSRIEEIDGDDD